MKNRQTIMNKSITNHKTIIEKSMKNLSKISKNHQKWLRKLQMASMMHTCVGFVGLKWAHKQNIRTFPTFLKISRWPKVTKVPHFLAAWGSKK